MSYSKFFVSKYHQKSKKSKRNQEKMTKKQPNKVNKKRPIPSIFFFKKKSTVSKNSLTRVSKTVARYLKTDWGN